MIADAAMMSPAPAPVPPEPVPLPPKRHQFRGHIAGAGTSSGTRLVLGCWVDSPFGAFADVMIQRADQHRLLIAPSTEVARFVAATYQFDEVTVCPVSVQRTGLGKGTTWSVEAGPLTWEFALGRRHPAGCLLRAVPPALGRLKTTARVTNRAAPLVMPGVRTLGTAGGGRTEWYAAHDLHRIRASEATWEGHPLGILAPVDPPAQFGFSSTPVTPCVTAVTSTVTVPATSSHRP